MMMLATPGVAVDVYLKPYQASYALYRGNLNVAKSQISLDKSDQYWRWSQSSKPIGIYSLFSDNDLYAETDLFLVDKQYKIYKILLKDKGDKSRYENARFNWNNQQVDIEYKDKKHVEIIRRSIYDSLSIHLLTAQMLKHNLQESVFDFYHRGRLMKSHLKRSGKSKLEINKKLVDVFVFEQSSVESSSKIKFYYDPDRPLLPIKIERTKPGKKSTTMLLQSVKWN